MFRNRLTANDNYPVLDFVNLSSLIQMQLSLKPTIFSDFFVLFLECRSNFEDLEKKDDRHTYFILEITECENLLRPLSKKHRSRTPFDSQHVKGSQILVKSS